MAAPAAPVQDPSQGDGKAAPESSPSTPAIPENVAGPESASAGENVPESVPAEEKMEVDPPEERKYKPVELEEAFQNGELLLI